MSEQLEFTINNDFVDSEIIEFEPNSYNVSHHYFKFKIEPAA